MPIGFKTKLDSAVANATFLDKTIDDKTEKQLGLENPDSVNHGEVIVSAQLQINKNSKSVNAVILDILDAGQISLDPIIETQYVRIQGAGSATTINSLPFGNTITPQDYSEIILVGQDDTNTVTIDHNNSDYGCLLNGNATLQLGYMLVLIYDDNLKRYIEKSRNF